MKGRPSTASLRCHGGLGTHPEVLCIVTLMPLYDGHSLYGLRRNTEGLEGRYGRRVRTEKKPQISPRLAPRQAGAGGTGRLRSEAVTFISLVVCGRKAPKSSCQQASPGSFDSAPYTLCDAIDLRGASLRMTLFGRGLNNIWSGAKNTKRSKKSQALPRQAGAGGMTKERATLPWRVVAGTGA